MAIVDSPQLARDVLATLEQGMDSGRATTLLKPEKCAYAENVTVRGGYAKNRLAFIPHQLHAPTEGSSGVSAFANGVFQGAEVYDVDNGMEYLMCMVGGRLLQLNVDDMTCMDITATYGQAPMEAHVKMCWMVQADIYFCVQDGVQSPYIYTWGAGTTGTLRRSGAGATQAELPVGQQMAYGQGRLWLAQGRQFVAGDIYGGPTSVINFTEQTYIAEATQFGVPLQAGDIVGLTFIEQNDTSTGQGDLMVVARNAIWTVHTSQVPRDQWQLTPGIITIGLSKVGGTGQRNLIDVNSDMFFRSRDGWRSYRMARNVQLYSQWGWGAGQGGFWGYTPISREMTRVLWSDTLSLLDWCSACLFKNRLLMTANPVPQPPPLGYAPYFPVIMALDFEVVSGMTDKLPPAWEGAWTGLQVYQVVSGVFQGSERCFAICRNPSNNQNELWEIDDQEFFDQQNVPITSIIETRAYDCQKAVNPKRIRSAKLYFTNVLGNTEVTVKYRSDGYPCWIPWHQFTINSSGCHLPGDEIAPGIICNVPLCTIPGWCPSPEIPNQPAGGYWFAQNLPTPDQTCDPVTRKLFRNGYYFEFQIKWKGPATLQKFVLYCDELIEDPNGNCAPNPGL